MKANCRVADIVQRFAASPLGVIYASCRSSLSKANLPFVIAEWGDCWEMTE